jgi:hypothetical protein
MSTPIVTTDLTPADAVPFWQLNGPCSHWCEGGHSVKDHPDDRVHVASERTEVLLAHEKLDSCDYEVGADAFIPPALIVLVERHEHEKNCRIVVDKNDVPLLRLSRDEALQVIAALQTAVKTADLGSL